MTELATTVAGSQPRQEATIRGRVVAVRIEPADAAPSFTVQIDDGTGRIDAVFMGRRAIPGIEPGAQVEIQGTVCAAQALPCVFNPRYELLTLA